MKIGTKMLLGNYTICEETEEQPKMVEFRMNNLYQDAFCYGLAIEENEKKEDVILAIIVAGNDSSLQALKASMDIGSNGISFGFGVKENTSWSFQSEIYSLTAQKGKYTRFPLPIEGESAFKSMAIVHDDVLVNGDYVLSFNENPADDLLPYFGGSKHGLHLLPEWKEPLYTALQENGYLKEIPMYMSEGFQMRLLKLNITEEQGDNLVTQCIQKGIFSFPGSVGTGEKIKEIGSLENYLSLNVDSMIEKVNEQVSPSHEPTIDDAFPYFDEYDRPLFPVQAHVATALVKKFKKQNSVLLEGEMSTGKTTMMTAVADAYARNSGKKGFFSCVMVPPNLTKKWPQEIKDILKNAEVHLIENTSQLIRYHAEWTRQGRPSPTKPTFFVISYNTMRDGSAIRPACEFQYKKTTNQATSQDKPYRFGWYCPSCGKPHQKVIDSQTTIDENGNEVEEVEKEILLEYEFGTTRRIHKTKSPANAFCSECGESLWTKKVVNRYENYKDWTTHEKKLIHAIQQPNSKMLVSHIQKTQEPVKKSQKFPRKVAAIDYIKRKMKNFFDLAIVDEIHLTKSGNTAQGNALGALAAASKKLVGGTGTLFGGKAEDIYYILWRLFPYMMKANGFEYSEVSKWNHEYGNIEKTITTYNGESIGDEYSNKNSHGGSNTRSKEKVLPGISPFVYGKFLVQNSCLVRLVDVWPDPVELVDVPTIFVPMNPELRTAYDDMVRTFEKEIDKRKDGKKLYLPLTQNGVAYPDNPFTYPDMDYKLLEGESGLQRQRIWNSVHLDTNILLNKEKKLQDIIQDEMSEGRKSIVYVRDTGSSIQGRDVRPRLQKVLSDIGARVCILDTTTTKTNNRSEWLKEKMEEEGYDVCIVSQELVKVGLDLLCTPTLIFYQFSWSLFTINQAARRAWRIGQTEECRLFYIAYKDSYQEQMAELIAKKKKATAAISGDVSSDGLAAMLGDEGDLQTMLVKSIKSGETIKGSAEEWVSQTSDRARELLSEVGKKKQISSKVQFINWVRTTINGDATKNILINKADTIIACIEKGKREGFVMDKGVLSIDLVEAFGFDMVDDKAILSHLVVTERNTLQQSGNTIYEEEQLSLFTVSKNTNKQKRKGTKKGPIDGQLGFDLFAG
ncbi:hypothetical protein MACH08_40310 [Oceanobacillus kimchii]|uniref:Helicase C-terminal domain-containing protein n=1 Tax=Oceanobacillus kimchii TaxID=746691 RepID=A0ABQ5TT33_9BACI|nr:hypothetical protein MACH08_40310 [Oceanobacillus kimchii]